MQTVDRENAPVSQKEEIGQNAYFGRHIIRKSVAILVGKIILTELLVAFVYVFVRIVLNYMYQAAPLDLNIPTNFIGFLSISTLTMLQTIGIIFISLRWATEYYEVLEGVVIYHSGILTKKAQEYSLKGVQSVEYNESIFGRLFHYGTVRSFSPALQRELLFEEVNNPEEFVHLLKKAAGDNTMGFLIRRR